MMNRMKLTGRIAAKNHIKAEGVESARFMTHALILDAKGRLDFDEYTKGWLDQMNETLDTNKRK